VVLGFKSSNIFVKDGAMPVGLLKDILTYRPEGVPLMGLDVGSRTIGLALSNDAQTIATPLKTIKRKKFTSDIKELAAIATEYGVKGFVVGYPLNMDGSAGRACDVVRSFADEMSKCEGLFGPEPWIALWDERLSTASVEDFVGKSVDIKKAKEKGLIDQLAAHVILQGALEYIADHSA